MSTWRINNRINFNGCKILATNNVSCSANVETAIPFDTIELDTLSIWNSSSNTRITVPSTVTLINVRAGGTISTGSSTDGYIAIRKNGNVTIQKSQINSTTLQASSVETGPLKVITGDYFELVTQKTATSTFITNTGNGWISMEILETSG